MSRALFHCLFALLLAIAGPAGASHSQMQSSEAHCEEMEGHHFEAHASADDASMAEGQDCETQCYCCPGTCSGTVAVTTSPAALSLHSVSHPPIGRNRPPSHTPAELLRPPILA